MANGIFTIARKAIFSPNILPTTASFASDITINKLAGTSGSSIAFSSSVGYRKYLQGSIRAFNDSNITSLSFNFDSALTKTIGATGTYFLSIELRHIMPTVQMFPDQLNVHLKINGTITQNMLCTLKVEDDDLSGHVHSGKIWGTYSQKFVLNASDVFDLQFELITSPTKPAGYSELWIDAIKLELDDRLLDVPSLYSEPLS